MGTDIHVFFEVKKKGHWLLAPEHTLQCPECRGTGKDFEDGPFCKHCGEEREGHEGDKCLFDSTTFIEDFGPCTGYRCSKGQVFNKYDLPRNYKLFAALSGVRGGPVPIWTQVRRNLPADVSPELCAFLRCSGYHNHGYYSLQELRVFPLKGIGKIDPELVNTWREYIIKDIIPKMRSYGVKKSSDVRMVFAYDN